MIGTTGDPATPYEYAESMARQLRSGVLVTLNGEGPLGVRAERMCQRDSWTHTSSVIRCHATGRSAEVRTFHGINCASPRVMPLDIVGDRAEPAEAKHWPP